MLVVKNISFAYHKTPILKNINFTIESRKHVALIGASGCGKSTLLKIIYGLLDANEGAIFWNNKQVLGPLFNLVPGEENMKYLSQGYDLQKYRTVSENIGQHLSRFEPELKQGRTNELLQIVEMEDYANTKVEHLSGGQMQRVALARVLAKKPELLLLDEPFGNIDNFRRSALRRNLYAYLTRNKITSITATHDKTDILSFTDDTIVMEQGQLLTKKPTLDIYRNPDNYYVASLFGEVSNIPLQAINDTGQKGNVLVYPHQIEINDSSKLKARVKNSYFYGSYYLIEGVFKENIIFMEHPTYIDPNTEISIKFNLENQTIAQY